MLGQLRDVTSPAAANLLMPTITPSSRTTRKRKRLRETLHQLARDTPSPAVTSPGHGTAQVGPARPVTVTASPAYGTDSLGQSRDRRG